MKLNKLFHFIPFVIGLLLMTTVFTGCSDDDDELQQTAFGLSLIHISEPTRH